MNDYHNIDHFFKNNHKNTDDTSNDFHDSKLNFVIKKPQSNSTNKMDGKHPKSNSTNKMDGKHPKLKTKLSQANAKKSVKTTTTVLHRSARKIKLTTNSLFKQGGKMINNLWGKCVSWWQDITKPIDIKTHNKSKQKAIKISINKLHLDKKSGLKSKQLKK